MPATRCTEGNLLDLHQRAAVPASRGGFWLVQGLDISQHGEQGYVME